MHKHILIVDDEPEICLLLSRIIESNGLAVNSVHSMSEAKQELNDNHPDVVFLDVNLPDGMGLDLIPIIKKNTPDAKIVVISAFDAQEDREKAMNRGARKFLGKPFTKTEVLDTLNELMVTK